MINFFFSAWLYQKTKCNGAGQHLSLKHVKKFRGFGERVDNYPPNISHFFNFGFFNIIFLFVFFFFFGGGGFVKMWPYEIKNSKTLLLQVCFYLYHFLKSSL